MILKRVKLSPEDQQAMGTLLVDPQILVDDFCDYREVAIKKPWGHEYMVFHNGQVSVWMMHLHKDAQNSLHCHLNKRTALVVLEGEVLFHTLHERFNILAGSGLVIDPGAFHSSQAISEGGAVIMEAETPTNKRDLVRLKDFYGRQQGYEGKEHHLPNTFESFHKQPDRYGAPKRFGQCLLTIAYCPDEQALSKILNNQESDLIALLSGELLAVYSTPTRILDKGEITETVKLRRFPEVRAAGPLELLLIKKINLQ